MIISGAVHPATIKTPLIVRLVKMYPRISPAFPIGQRTKHFVPCQQFSHEKSYLSKWKKPVVNRTTTHCSPSVRCVRAYNVNNAHSLVVSFSSFHFGMSKTCLNARQWCTQANPPARLSTSTMVLSIYTNIIAYWVSVVNRTSAHSFTNRSARFWGPANWFQHSKPHTPYHMRVFGGHNQINRN